MIRTCMECFCNLTFWTFRELNEKITENQELIKLIDLKSDEQRDEEMEELK